MELAPDLMIRDYKLPFETLSNLKINKKKINLKNYFARKINTKSYISNFSIRIANKIFLIILTKTYKIVNILETRIDQMGHFVWLTYILVLYISNFYNFYLFHWIKFIFHWIKSRIVKNRNLS